MNIDFKGWNENVATFLTKNIKPGELATMDGNFTVRAAENGNEIIGVCVGRRGDYAAIQLSGYVETKYTNSIDIANKKSTDVRLGIIGLSAYNSETVMPSKNANVFRVIFIDEHSKTIGFIL